MKNNNTIMWEKWQDPFGFDEDLDLSDEIDTESQDDESIIDDLTQYSKTKNIKHQIIATPFGIIPINENTASGSIFNFWTGHSNFPITKKVAKIIEDTEGIETLNVFTKYRFRIAIGKAFNDSHVMREVNYNVYKYLNNKNV
jgi:hypothetical protein